MLQSPTQGVNKEDRRGKERTGWDSIWSPPGGSSRPPIRVTTWVLHRPTKRSPGRASKSTDSKTAKSSRAGSTGTSTASFKGSAW